MVIAKTISKRSIVINLVSFYVSVFVLWFGVFKLRLYDASGFKQQISGLVLLLLWLFIAKTGLTNLYISVKKRRGGQFKRLGTPAKLAAYLASIMVVLSLAILLVFVILIALVAMAYAYRQL